MYFHNFKEFFREIVLVFKQKRFFYSVKYCLWVILDRLRGVDFVKNEGNEKIGIKREQGCVYQATRDISCVKQILQKFDIKQNDSILDMGCGKGYMLKFFSTYPFGKVDGVELSERLCNIARHNIKKMKMNKCTVYHADASEFTQYDEYTFIYTFDSFPYYVMEKVMENIKMSLQRKNRKIILIYKSPVCHEIIMNSGIFKLQETVMGKTLPYNVYVTK